MKTGIFWIYLLVMFAVTYVVRVLPFVAFHKKIENKFVRSFLAYIPYTVLGAMTFPAVLCHRFCRYSGGGSRCGPYRCLSGKRTVYGCSLCQSCSFAGRHAFTGNWINKNSRIRYVFIVLNQGVKSLQYTHSIYAAI